MYIIVEELAYICFMLSSELMDCDMKHASNIITHKYAPYSVSTKTQQTI